MSLPAPRLFNPLTDSPLLPQLAQIHAACITHDHQLASFLPPLDLSRMTSYWESLSKDVEAGKTAVFLQMTAAEGENGEGEGEVAGYVCLSMPVTETGPFRASVEKLMVSPNHRRKGVARRVLSLLEHYAKEKGRFLLMLDTTIGLPAEHVYPKLGYRQWGVLPKYGISPLTGELVDEKFFVKDLRDVAPLEY